MHELTWGRHFPVSKDHKALQFADRTTGTIIDLGQTFELHRRIYFIDGLFWIALISIAVHTLKAHDDETYL